MEFFVCGSFGFRFIMWCVLRFVVLLFCCLLLLLFSQFLGFVLCCSCSTCDLHFYFLTSSSIAHSCISSKCWKTPLSVLRRSSVWGSVVVYHCWFAVMFHSDKKKFVVKLLNICIALPDTLVSMSTSSTSNIIFCSFLWLFNNKNCYSFYGHDCSYVTRCVCYIYILLASPLVEMCPLHLYCSSYFYII